MAILVKSATAAEDKNFWATTWHCFFDAERLYNKPFQLDVAAEYRSVMAIQDGVIRSDTVTTAKVPNFFMLPWSNALENEWVNDWWCNPPFDDKIDFVKKAVEQSQAGKSGMMLIPCELLTDWWVEYVEPYADTIFVPNGRYPFYERDGYTQKSGVNFGSCFVLFTPHKRAPGSMPRMVRFKRTQPGNPRAYNYIGPPADLHDYPAWKEEVTKIIHNREGN